MSRLTVRGATSQRDINRLLELSNDNQFGRNEAYYKLRHYEDLEEQCRLIELPCKVGDTVYFALIGRIIEKKVFSIVSFSNSTRIYCGGTSEYFRPEDIGKTVFLTREEAEKALREMEGKKDG